MSENDVYRTMVLWHEKKYVEARDGTGDEVIRGAHMAAHAEAIEYCRARIKDEAPPEAH